MKTKTAVKADHVHCSVKPMLCIDTFGHECYGIVSFRKDNNNGESWFVCEPNADSDEGDVITHVYAELPPTAQQATSCKSLPNFLYEVDGEIKIGVDGDTSVTDEWNNWLKQPHPQDSSSGEVEKLQAFKDYVHKRLDEAGIPTHPDGENSKHGCRIGDRLDIVIASWMKALIKEAEADTPPASESLEQAALKEINDFNECMKQNGWLELMYDENKQQIARLWFVKGAQSTQQQKPLVVLPDEKPLYGGSEYMKTYGNGWNDCLKEVKDQLSAANGVDPVEWGLWLVHYMAGDPTVIPEPSIDFLFEQYIDEQSQQQNKGK